MLLDILIQKTDNSIKTSENRNITLIVTGLEGVVDVLIENKADLDALNSQNNTALIIAINEGIHLSDFML